MASPFQNHSTVRQFIISHRHLGFHQLKVNNIKLRGRKHAPFFYKWMALVVLVSLVFSGNIAFYRRLDAWWAAALSWVAAGLLCHWLLPQPLVPALYFRQADRRLRVALRNAAVLTLTDPLSTIVLWLALLALAIPLGYIAWPLLFLLQVFMALLSTRLVWLRLKHLTDPPSKM